MHLRREAGLGIGSILALQLLLSSLAIVLLTRMGPAIERILEDNVFSSAAVEDMLAVLAEPTGVADPTRDERFAEALGRARRNITEDAERPLIALIEQQRSLALRGEEAARRDVIDALRGLAQVNRDSMEVSDQRARRLGQAGAWSAAMLGALAFALGILVYQRLRLRLELPVEVLRQTLERVRAGDMRARCVVAVAPVELRDIARDLNVILDRWARQTAAAAIDERHDATDVRRLMLTLLDRESVPTLVLAPDGHVVAMNQAMQDLTPPAIDAEGQVEAGWELEALTGTSLRLVRKSAA